MEGIQGVSAQSNYQLFQFNAKFELQATIISSTLDQGSNDAIDTVDTSLSGLYAGLTGTTKSIIDKLNELLKAKLPNGIQSLKPEEVTPEATAERIVKGIAGLFSAYSKSNPDLSNEEIIEKFMNAARSGVQAGYDDAFDTLKGLGAFDIDGVQGGVEQTKILLETKLKELEEQIKKQLGVGDAGTPDDIAKTAILTQAGGAVAKSQLNVVA